MGDRYLLIWPSHTKPPLMHRVRVIAVHNTDAGPWVEFEFLGGPERGMRSGAPFQQVITEKESSIVESAAGDIHLHLEQAKQINKTAKDIYQTVTRNLDAAIRASHLQE